MLNCFPLSAEPSINVDLRGNRKRSNSNVPRAYKLEFSHSKLSWISWSKTTLIIFTLLLWPTVNTPHNNILPSSGTTEMETSVLEAAVWAKAHSRGRHTPEAQHILRTCKDTWHSTQRPSCNLVHQRQIYCLLIKKNFCCCILILEAIQVHYGKK